MKIAILTETFGKNMGYAGSMLPKHLARLGAEVHVITMDLLPYHQMTEYQQVYQGFSRTQDLVPGSTEPFEGYTLHVLGHRPFLGYMRMVGLADALRAIRPDIVQTFAAIGPVPLDAALLKLRLGYRLFTGSHTTVSVFPLAQRQLPWWHPERLRCLALRAAPGRVISWLTETCYGATGDCAEVAVRFFGVPRSKITVCPLGVDTDIFHPAAGEGELRERQAQRAELGWGGGDIACIYTGRFTDAKNPLLLARAVERLRRDGQPFRGLFLGSGPQRDRLALDGCSAMPFQPISSLGRYFRAADVGVWPTQESTSMLDAAACGLPVVVNHTLLARERVEGNGLTYRLNELDDLVLTLRRLQDPALRRQLGDAGAAKMRERFSWDSIARGRLLDFEKVLGTGR
jgi:glycosyltransferase involved in cell wall biosynthesis